MLTKIIVVTIIVVRIIFMTIIVVKTKDGGNYVCWT